MICSTRSPSVTIVGLVLELLVVIDVAAARLLTERGVRLVAEPAHVDLFLEQREPVGLELREVEHVADKTFEPRVLARDHVQGGVARGGSSTIPSRSASTWPRIAVSGVRSSCDTLMRKLRSCCSASERRIAISRNRLSR